MGLSSGGAHQHSWDRDGIHGRGHSMGEEDEVARAPAVRSAESRHGYLGAGGGEDVPGPMTLQPLRPFTPPDPNGAGYLRQRVDVPAEAFPLGQVPSDASRQAIQGTAQVEVGPFGVGRRTQAARRQDMGTVQSEEEGVGSSGRRQYTRGKTAAGLSARALGRWNPAPPDPGARRRIRVSSRSSPRCPRPSGRRAACPAPHPAPPGSGCPPRTPCGRLPGRPPCRRCPL